MNKPLTICFVTEDFYPGPIGGQGIWGNHLVTTLANQGHRVTVIAENRKGRLAYWAHKKNVTVRTVPCCFGNQLVLAFTEYLRFVWPPQHEAIDVVHANQLSGLLFALLRPPNARKLVISVHNTYADMCHSRVPAFKRMLYRWLWIIERSMYRRADALLFHTLHEMDESIRNFGLDKSKCFIAQIGVSHTKYTQKDKEIARTKICRQLSISETQKIVLYVGRLVRRKNVDLLIRAVNNVYQITCVIVGAGTEMGRLQSLASSNVRFTGYVDETRDYFLAADCFGFLSDAEGGVALSVLEAATYGLPIVVSPSGSSFDISNGINGFVVFPEKITEVSKAVSAAVRSPRMGNLAYKSVLKFTWNRCVRETLNAYVSLPKKQSDKQKRPDSNGTFSV